MSYYKTHSCSSCGSEFFADAKWKRVCLDCWKKANGIPNKPPRGKNVQPHTVYVETPIEEEMLRRLIHLCHPDKHGNSLAATTATEWLLSKRSK